MLVCLKASIFVGIVSSFINLHHVFRLLLSYYLLLELINLFFMFLLLMFLMFAMACLYQMFDSTGNRSPLSDCYLLILTLMVSNLLLSHVRWKFCLSFYYWLAVWHCLSSVFSLFCSILPFGCYRLVDSSLLALLSRAPDVNCHFR